MTVWRWLMALLLWAAGAWLSWGGAQLLLAGGSGYYVIAGLLLLVVGGAWRAVWPWRCGCLRCGCWAPRCGRSGR